MLLFGNADLMESLQEVCSDLGCSFLILGFIGINISYYIVSKLFCIVKINAL